MTKLQIAARSAIRDVLGVKPGERVLIVTNPSRDVKRISEALAAAAAAAGAKTTVLVQPVKTQLDVTDRTVLKAIETKPDVVISMSKEKIGKMPGSAESPLQRLLDRKRMRTFWSPSATVKIFEETVAIDYAALRTDVAALARHFRGAVATRVTAPSGTDITVGMKGRIARKDDGDYRKRGSGGNLPAGEVYVSPALGSSNGLIVFDGSIAALKGMIMIRKPITCVVKGGFVTDITGGAEAIRLLECIRTAERAKRITKNVRNLGEFGIGMNRKAKIVGNILEDEKVYGTCHFAIGANFEGDAPALIHLDGLVKKPTIRIMYRNGSERIVMMDGKLTGLRGRRYSKLSS